MVLLAKEAGPERTANQISRTVALFNYMSLFVCLFRQEDLEKILKLIFERIFLHAFVIRIIGNLVQLYLQVNNIVYKLDNLTTSTYQTSHHII